MAASQVGIPYGYLDVITLGLAQVGLAKGWVATRIENPTTLFCSQQCDEALWMLGFHAFTDGRLPHNVTPGDLFDNAVRTGWEFEVVPMS
ncbi:hypothetical protein [Georgenia wangjunii]|uniref:hypothetical protein n=1 Tax=Georgenia wangjunii TaxID=3117730 RepID=UPI002F262183